MSYKNKRYEVFNSACAMAVRHLLRSEGLSLLSEAELANLLGVSEYFAKSLVKGELVTSGDLSAICDSIGIDFGVSIRKPSGEEITFYPAQNFGAHNVVHPPRPAKQEVPEPVAETTTPAYPISDLYAPEEG